jgi:5-methylcytosine-specific restriction endonuclease McrA
MPVKFCLGCHELTTNGSYCEKCQEGRDAAQNSRPRYSQARGLGSRHRARAKAVVAAAQVCERCGKEPTPDNPLTAHHVVARAKGGDDTTPLVALCRRCNSSIGDRT